MFALKIIILITLIVPLNYDLCSCQCARAEYKIDKQCCPMCAPGNRVRWHCTDDTSTTCVPCPPLTFLDEPNGLMECFPCTVCDANRGLRLSEVCTRSSDAVCGPLERFYCIEKKKGSCTLAVRHSKCNPGQYIKQAGTGSTDTVCADCTGDTYSNGSFSSCLPHTKCEAMGLAETNPGTHSSDSECGNPPTAVAIIASSVIVTLILITVVSVLIFKHIRKKKLSKSSGLQETGNGLHEKHSSKDWSAAERNISFLSKKEIHQKTMIRTC
ncbi:tumor necrosis factor receptor superfamily member 14-like isoform X1 [Sinocyclocheilus anshuiensis]|uniref:tumor necrosis factor receptor superfamily member 14-like isoform X1 n=1 Tax=Sinocyclocheilus anshuiensis TaxID=1608454 RepID=UPI0007B96B66|nr:PREDICTED: tumor necrosis factor receptor superfamily member 14-like isoform X1 [Sinocyclocheilus anshuiensis]XP_016350613.1 PREDICTED: tumor necrosis factor receptor superfamily member 14-like isoform X1 [Sinocyclocheilus anshuiensis]